MSPLHKDKVEIQQQIDLINETNTKELEAKEKKAAEKPQEEAKEENKKEKIKAKA